MTHRLRAISKHSLRTRRSGISHLGQVCGPSGRCHQPHGICSLQRFPTVSVLMHLHQMIWLWLESAFDQNPISLFVSAGWRWNTFATRRRRSLSFDLSFSSMKATWRCTTDPKLPFKNQPCVRVSYSAWATPMFDNSRCAAAQSLWKTDKQLYLDHHHHQVKEVEVQLTIVLQTMKTFFRVLLWLLGRGQCL